jgi:EAL domain-containing protein (putative c-di-GMP-specific phosphodiesterase class I)
VGELLLTPVDSTLIKVEDLPVSVTNVLLPAQASFYPLVDLDTGNVIAVETHTGPAEATTFPDSRRLSELDLPLTPPARVDPAEEDVRRALRAARVTAELGSQLPLQLIVRAETVAEGQIPLTTLHQGLLDIGRRPQEVIMCMTGGFAPAQRMGVSAALHGLRRAGYLIGFGGLGSSHAPLDLLVDDTPYLMKLDPDLARTAFSDPRKSALVEALVSIAHRVGTHVLAPGVATEDQLVHLRALGVRLVQGPLLSGEDWRPGMRVTVPVPVEREKPSNGSHRNNDLGPRVSEFTMPAVTMGMAATAEDVLTVLNDESGTTSVVLVDEQQRPHYTVDRTRFLLKISGAYGHALHAHKPAARLADAPRLVPRTVPAIAALRAAGKESERVYDDLVVIDEIGRCLGIVRVADLIRSLSP